MCGIAGVLNLHNGEPVSEGTIRQMLGMIRHRGPDEFGIYLDQQVGLGSARLSILDLDGGQQPIGNEASDCWIVFNGEVFNHPDLRAELEARGRRFRTQTDTEVVLHAYEEYGPDCLNQFNGQFAIAIWDHRKRELFLARDRLGVRPLFYTIVNGVLVFGSEIKAILAHPLVRAGLDLVALHQVFTYWSPLSPRTTFRNIHELPPGHFVQIKDGELTMRRYWKLAFPAEQERGNHDHRSVEDCLAEFRDLLMAAVRMRLRADVPVGAYLSGGLDSSTIAAIVRRLGLSRLDTFSISFSDAQFDEGAFQRRMAGFLGTHHHVVHATHADIGRAFPDTIWHTEMPIMRTSPVPMFLLSKLVQSHRYKVVLTGEGADEFLAGYDIFKEAMIRRFWARRPDSKYRPHLLHRLYPDISTLDGLPDSFLKAFFGKGLDRVDDPCFSHAIRWENNRRTHRFFSENVRSAMENEGLAADGEPQVPLEFADWHPLARAQYLEISIFLSEYLLSSQGDRPAMAHSVEGRFPFLDARVVEFCNQLPPRCKLAGLKEKVLLRRAAREWLPDEIRQRGKRPYRAPIHRSFFGDSELEYVEALLDRKAIEDAGIFRAEPVERLVAKIKRGNALGETDDMALVGILSSQLVHRLFVANSRGAPPLAEADDVKVVDQALYDKKGQAYEGKSI